MMTASNPDTLWFTHDDARLAFRFVAGAGPLVVFLPGYMSDMGGTKACSIRAWAEAAGRACLLFDYSGCGESGGDFLKGSIGRWTGDAAALIGHVWPRGDVVLAGSSMGGWAALRLGVQLGARLAGLVGIAAAPDFVDWGLELSAAEAEALAAQGWCSRPSGYGGDYVYSKTFLEDAARCRMLAGPIAITAPVRLLHGQADEAVPWQLSVDIAGLVESEDVQVLLIKNGDHRLSNESEIGLMLAQIAAL